MLVKKGKSVYGGIAIGKIRVYDKKPQKVKRYKITDIDTEILRFEHARKKGTEELSALYDNALERVGEANAAIFGIHRMMLEDADYGDSVENIIRNENVNAEYAIGVTCDNFSEMFSSMEDTYMQERAADVRDVSDRLLKILAGKKDGADDGGASIIAAEDLLPSETVQMDKKSVLAFITGKGSVNSHTAILARTMNIPAIVCIGEDLTPFDGQFAIADGFTGTLYIDPDPETMAKMEERKKLDTENKKLLQSLKGQESITADGTRINIYANIGGLSDVADVLINDADGIGLFRSEFLYLEKSSCPDENEQFAVYKKVVQNMGGKKVIIRTLDVGADKKIPYFHLDKEENPAMGQRAVRLCLERPEIFKTQLRALYRASAFGDLAIMVPMVVSLAEVKKTKELIKEVKAELKNDNIMFDENTEFGIMIETPAAALISDELAKEVDFFSLGTNDLMQYTLAADRQNPKLDEICTPYHKALLTLIEMTVKNAHKNGIWAGICGETAADLNLTDFFLSIGVDELSVAPPKVLPLRKKIRETDLKTIPKGYPDVTTI